MKALVLAAGFGTRLRPLTDQLPKPLIPVNGVPMILYALALLKSQGFSDVVINLHYKGHLIQKVLGNGKKYGLTIRYSHEKIILGTGGGIRKALPEFAGEEDLLVINSDIVIDMDLRALLTQHRRDRNVATLVLRKHPDAKRFGELKFAGKRLVRILHASAPESKPQRKLTSAHFTGVHILQREPLLALQKNQASCIVRDFYQPQLQAGAPLGAHLLRGSWHDCGTLVALTDITQRLQSGKLRLSYANELIDLMRCLRER